MQLRATLEEMVIADLLGPAGGPDEEIDERNVRDRYLVGVLAPRRQPQEPQAKPDEDDEDEEVPAIPDELSEGGADTVDDGNTDKDVPIVKAHLPSSFGMSFCVDKSATALKVEVRWGQYKREKKEDQIDARTGRPKRVWKRHPKGGQITVKLSKEVIAPQTVDPAFPNVYVRGKVRKKDFGIIVTLFLVNGQEELPKGSKEGKDSVYLFQPELIVTDPDGGPIFCKRIGRRRSQNLDAGEKLELDTFDMLYRRHVEFAVGHGISVHADGAKDSPDRAVLLKTTVIPRYEVPRTTPPTASEAASPAFAKLADLVLDMKELAETPPKKLPAKLQPLITAYKEWIDQQEATVKKDKEAFKDYDDAPAEAIKRCRQNLTRIEAGIQLLEDAQAADAFCFMNRAMWLQRTHSLFSEQVRRGGQLEFEQFDIPDNRRWYPFQLAFILLNLPGITKLDHADRTSRVAWLEEIAERHQVAALAAAVLMAEPVLCGRTRLDRQGSIACRLLLATGKEAGGTRFIADLL
jgi:hypothetical protein